MCVRIICKKVPKLLNNNSNNIRILNKFTNYNEELSKYVSSFNGFIYSESFYKSSINNIYEQGDLILTLSEWDSFSSWNNWFNSYTRLNIKKKYKDIVEDEQIYVLKKEEFFLL